MQDGGDFDSGDSADPQSLFYQGELPPPKSEQQMIVILDDQLVTLEVTKLLLLDFGYKG